MWELVHTTMGRAIVILGLVNVAIGIHLFTSLFGGSFRFFALLAATPVACLALISSITDRLSWQSSHGAEMMDDHAATAATAAATADGRDSPAGPIQGGKSIGPSAP
ncbi:hypothetical protein VaNZ11_012970 [Volvox africanus]|uniref:Uncharacterized protein n=1 Tax=Volvox africanus TaxID=51714 RepID=A0ABQ5SF25_9CHLO|nr:hypothetical protein VaNZ11_012970 [Volvox africanus]